MSIKFGKELRKVGTSQAVLAACERALRKVYSRFAFDKLCYQVCRDTSSKHMARKHSCGNCYSAAIYCQDVLASTEGVDSYVVAGNVPMYFMKPGYKGICHAAVYVPEAGVILDPSIYAPPLQLSGKLCTPAADTIMRKFGDGVRCVIQTHLEDYLVHNRLNGQGGVRVPRRVPHVLVKLLQGGHEVCRYDYVLAPVLDFDTTVTAPVHKVNQSLFRVTTDSDGRFKHKIELLGDVVRVTNYLTGRVVSIPLNDHKSHRQLCKLCPPGILKRSFYCC